MDASAIRTLRKQLKLSQEEMAWECNVSISTIRAWEQGIRQPGGSALRVLQLLNSARATPRRTRVNMPTVAHVSGVKVMVFYNDHDPPHVHLSKADMDIVVPIGAPALPPWAFSHAERRAIVRWMKDHHDGLMRAWERARAGENPGQVE